MEHQSEIHLLAMEIRRFAGEMKKKVGRGSESPASAAELARSYGEGVVDAAVRSLELSEPPALLQKTIEDEVRMIDHRSAKPEHAVVDSGRRRRISR